MESKGRASKLDRYGELSTFGRQLGRGVKMAKNGSERGLVTKPELTQKVL